MREIDIYAYCEGSFFVTIVIRKRNALCLKVIINRGIHKYPFLLPFLLTKTNTHRWGEWE